MIATIVGVLAVVGLFVGRLVDIQVVQADELNAQSAGKRSIELTTYGARGDIVDTNGVVLADSVMRYDITASPKNSAVGDARTVNGTYTAEQRVKDITAIADASGLSAADITAKLDKDLTSDYVLLGSGLTLDKRNAVKKAQADLNIGWVYTVAHPSRTYPRGSVAGPLVGFLGTDGPQMGLELGENACLASTDGSSTYERSLDGVPLPGSTVVDKAAKDGGTLKLTVNSDLQWYVQQRIAEAAKTYGAEWATGVVIRVKDGHLMAVGDYPSLDPNDINASPAADFQSRAFSNTYEPGSTFKAMTAATLLDQGKITQTTPVSVPSIFTTKGGTIQDVFSHGTMNWTTTGILVVSSNIGVSELTKKLDAKTRYEYMLKFGLGQKTEVDAYGEASGQLKPYDEWDGLTNYAVQFGQGVAATSVQVASIYQTLGNNGVRMPVTLVEGCEQPDGTVTELPSDEGTRVVSETAADQTVEMLENVATKGSLRQAVAIDGYNIAVKSGTAQVAKAGGGYGTDRVVSVAGLVTGENPDYAIVVTLGMPKINKTSQAAAPAWHDIAEQVIKTYRIMPSTGEVPDLPCGDVC
jgi:cell division protein FtsI (penicillin-binding protein 3)